MTGRPRPRVYTPDQRALIGEAPWSTSTVMAVRGPTVLDGTLLGDFWTFMADGLSPGFPWIGPMPQVGDRCVIEREGGWAMSVAHLEALVADVERLASIPDPVGGGA